jgi:hypothetical protein
MDDPNAGAPAPVCPWCSAELKAGVDTCPSCGATLTSRSEPQIPGVTTVAGSVASTRQKPVRASRLMRWINGEPDDSVTLPPATPGSLALPPDDVQREIRRLEIEAELTNLSAEASAIAAEDAVEARAAHDEAGAQAALRIVHDARAVTEALEKDDAPAAATDEPHPQA